MTLAPGTRLGPYEILSPLGAGGMGEVYRARDTRLGRDVAVKVLPSHRAASAEMRERFEREARAISSLNHPHICTLHDIGSHDGTDYLVMEIVDGETLASRLERGPLKLEEALRLAVQVAGGLAAAHRQGIVHRDLKPGNVMLTRSGAKILDFGVAKLCDEAAPGWTGSGALPAAVPTRTTPLTTQGALVGTMQYMAPEQLEGKPVDHRADLFSFGAVLYEAITGKRAFEGSSQASVIASILEREPRPLSELVPTSPANLDRAIRRCLAKDPDERWHSALDLKSELEWLAGTTASGSAPAATARAVTRRTRPRWAIAGALAGAAAMLALGWALHRPAAAPLIRSSIVLPKGVILDSDNASIALAPDGSRLAYAAREAGGPTTLWVRPLDSLVGQPLSGTEGATYPSWSPDGSHLAFFADKKLKKIPASGGPVQTICPAEDGRGASWGAGDVIVFSPAPFGGLSRVPASGGTPTALTTASADTISHRNPHFLPDGKRVLYFAGKPGPDPENGVFCADIGTKKSEPVLHAESAATYVEPGYLVFVRDGNLLAQPFDPSSRRLSGEAVPIAEKVQFNAFRRTGTYTLSDTGLLLSLSDSIQRESQLTWFDLDGKVLGTVGQPAMFWNQLRFSPDDRRVVTGVRQPEGSSDLWTYDLARGVGSKFTFGETSGLFPAWSPDGRQVAYGDGSGFLWVKSADGTSAPRKLNSQTLGSTAPVAWTPDGSCIVIASNSGKMGSDLLTLPVNGDGKVSPLLSTAASERGASFSPDGRWMAYVSDESGRNEFYVTSFPSPGGKWQVSTGGAERGGWLGDGKETWYADTDGRFYAVPIATAGGSLDVGTRRPLLGGQILPIAVGNFTRDGKRFLGAVQRVGTTGPILTLVTRWASEFDKK
jgi:Tol biopolymer transport system component